MIGGETTASMVESMSILTTGWDYEQTSRNLDEDFRLLDNHSSLRRQGIQSLRKGPLRTARWRWWYKD